MRIPPGANPGCAASPATESVEPSALSDLLARVEAATGPDRELDVLVAGVTGYRNRFTGEPLSDWLADPERREEAMRWEGVPYVTASLDAALALVERVLPGMAPCLELDARPRAYLYERNGYTIGSQRQAWKAYADAPTPALAVLVAMLCALTGSGAAVPAQVER